MLSMSTGRFVGWRSRLSVSRWLVILLLVGQGLLTLHLIGHQVGLDDQPCPICMQVQAARSETPPPLPVAVFCLALGGLAPLLVLAPRAIQFTGFGARAPPSHPV